MNLFTFRIILTFVIVGLFNTTLFAARPYGGHYTAERIANLRKNCEKYDWAKRLRASAIERARSWVERNDEYLWTMVPGQDLPRCIDVTFDRLNASSKFVGCLNCGNKIFKYGNYPYDPDFENKPWKLVCPSCKAVFPTNDFGKYYKSGIDEHGVFNPDKGDKSLLYNTDHPDPKDPLHKFGVDDGYGFIDQSGRAHKFIGYYSWKYWRNLYGGLAALANAYLYTGEQRYAHKAAILLDRIADIYPSMDWKPYAERGWYHSDKGTMKGKIEGSIWETSVIKQIADAYDKILSGTQNDPALYKFLKKQSKKYQLPKPKGTRDQFIENVDDGILRCAFKAVVSGQIFGNEGMHQLAAATCAIALNTNPETTQWLDWLFAPKGGAIPRLMITMLDHDGSTNEGAPNYSVFLGLKITDIGELIEQYPQYTNHNIFQEFPQLNATYLMAYRLAALGVAIPNIGDSGATGLVATNEMNPKFIAMGYLHTHDPDIAIAAYRANGNSAEGLGRDIYSSDPDKLSREIKQIGEKAGPRPAGGYLMSGFGLALLEAGTGSSGIALASNYGRTIKHAHPDMLNFDLFAFGHWLSPDLGYPEFATNWPNNTEWSGSTLSHNTVFVNKQPQKEIWSGHTQFFKQLKGFGAFELEGKKAYPDIKTYNRTMLLIGGSGALKSDKNAYAIDIFRVAGGSDHVYSFHGPPGKIEAIGLKLKEQETGTYAGEHIPKGTLAKKDFPIGYSHLYNVQRDQSPPAQFMLDWKVEAGYRGLTGEDDVHLRMYPLTQSDDIALADGDPPQNKPGNPEKLGYVLMHRTGTDLNSTFVSVIEPYKQQPFIKSVKRLDNGNSEEVAIQVEMIDGSIDYVLYNPSSQKVMQLSNGISMTGTVGYLREVEGKVQKGVLVNGSALKYGKLHMKSPGVITGKIVKMNKELAGGGWLLVDSKLPTDGSLNGEQIIIETKTDRDASYTIRKVEREGNLTKISCGPISFIGGHKGSSTDYTKDYLYDFEEGAGFKITSHKVWLQK